MKLRALWITCVLLVACQGEKTARVEELLDSGAALLPVELESVEGQRDGASTRASFVFRGSADTEMRVELVVAYDPQPVLRSGRWTYSGPTGMGAGTIEAESVRFVGGQGEGASVGGVYLLHQDGRARFRLDLPLQGIDSGWTVE